MFLNKLIILGIIVSCATLHSQNDSINNKSKTTNLLNEVVVTATRTKRQLSKIPMPVTLVSKKQISQIGFTRLRDVILEQTGMVTVSDFGNSEGVQLQGLDAEYVLILVDGLPLIGRTAGNIDLNRISVNNIKQIEIVKGASSSLYGSEVMGGVINIITEQPTTNQTRGNVNYMTRFGAKNELDMNGNFVHKKEKVAIISGVNLNSSNGFDLSPETISKTAYPHQNITANVRVNYNATKHLQFSLAGRYFNENIKSYQNNAKATDFNTSLTVKQKLTEKAYINYLVYATRYKTESVFNGSISVYNQTLYRPEIKVQFPLKKAEFIGGIGGNFDALERTFFNGKERYNAQYVFAQYDFNPLEKLNLVVGARFDNFNKFKSAFSPKIAMRYEVNKWLAIKPSVGLGYKVPDFRQLFFNFRNTSAGYIVLGTQVLHNLYGNLPQVQQLSKELKPESSIGYNFGFQLKPTPNLQITINFFRNDIKDVINSFRVSGSFSDLPNTSVFSYENRNKVYTQGLEFDVHYTLNRNFNFFFGYQFLDTADKQQIDDVKAGNVFFRRRTSSSSEQLTISDYFGLPNRSRHIANAKVFYKNFKHRLSANARIIFRSKYGLIDTNNNAGIIDDYDKFVASNTQVNVSVQKQIFNLMNIQVGIDNLFNEKGRENLENFNFDNVLRLGRTYYTRIQFNI